jgi:hypothetical protein
MKKLVATLFELMFTFPYVQALHPRQTVEAVVAAECSLVKKISVENKTNLLIENKVFEDVENTAIF